MLIMTFQLKAKLAQRCFLKKADQFIVNTKFGLSLAIVRQLRRMLCPSHIKVRNFMIQLKSC